MADLGSIPYQNVNAGTQVVDRSAEARAIGQGLSAVKGIVDEGIKAKVTGDVMQAIEDADTPEWEDTTEPVQYLPGSREEYLTSKLDRLQSLIEQGQSSQQELARMQVKQVLQEAQSKFPWLYEDLQSRANAVVAGSAKLDELGVQDQQRTQLGQEALKKFQELSDYAYGKFGADGLGIDPTLSVGDPQFIRQYIDRNQWAQVIRDSEANMAVMLAHAKQDFARVAPQFYSELYTNRGARHAFIQEAIINSGFEQFMQETQKGANGDLAFREEWIRTQGPLLIRTLRAQQAEVADLSNQLIVANPAIPQMEEFGKIKDAVAGAAAEYDTYINHIEEILKGTPNAEALLTTSFNLSFADALRQMPPEQRLLVQRTSAPLAEGFMRMVETHVTAGSMKLGRDVSLAYTMLATQPGSPLNPLINPEHPNHVGANAAQMALQSDEVLGVNKFMAPHDIVAAINARHLDPKASYLFASSIDEEDIAQALQSKDVWIDMMGDVKNVSQYAPPDYAGKTLLGLTYNLAYLNGHMRGKAKNVRKDLWSSLTSQQILDTVQLSLSGGPDGRRQALGTQVEKFYNDMNPVERRRELSEKYRSHGIGGVSTAALISVDRAALEKGTFTFKLNPNIQETAAKGLAGVDQWRDDKHRTRFMNMVEDEAAAFFAPIAQEVNSQIALERLIKNAKAPNAEAVKNDEFKYYYMGVDSFDSEKNHWSAMFNMSE